MKDLIYFSFIASGIYLPLAIALGYSPKVCITIVLVLMLISTLLLIRDDRDGKKKRRSKTVEHYKK